MTASHIGQTRVRDRPTLRKTFGAQNPVLPQWLRRRRLRVSPVGEFGRKWTFSRSTSVDSNDRYQLDSGPIFLQTSRRGSVDQIGESRPSLRSSQKAPESEIPSTPLHANLKPQEHTFPPPESENVKNSDRASGEDRAWEEVVATMEQTHEADLMDLREDMEALKAEHEEEILAANAKKLVLQKRVKKLLEDKSANDLRQENLRLRNLVATMGLKNEESNEILQNARRQNGLLEGQLAESQASNSLITENLLQARQASDYYRNRINQFNYVLEQQPGKYADVNREIELRDQRYSDLELKAGECPTAMSELEKKCLGDHEAACAEVADLKTKLQKQDADIASLEESKVIFQQHSEDVYGMLASRVLPSNLFDAMNEYFQLVIQDNGVLKSKIEGQMLEISSGKDKAKLLRYDNRSLETQQLLDRGIQSELEDKIRVQDIELGRLQFQIDSVVEEHLGEIQAKDSAITTLQASNDGHLREMGILAQNDARGLHHLVQTKNQMIAFLNTELNTLRGDKWELEQNEQARTENAKFEAVAVCLSERETEELKIRLGNADEELKELRERLRQYEF